MGYIILGVIFVIAGLTGEAVLRGTHSSGLLALAGFGMIGFGIYRQSNPRVRCRLCLAAMPERALRSHLSTAHPEIAGALDRVDAERSAAAAPAEYRLVVQDPGPRPNKIQKLIRESFGVDELTATAASRGQPLSGSFATVEGARSAIKAAGGQATTWEP